MMLRALAYILTHGYDGLREATEAAVLNARYITHGLTPDYEKPFAAPPMHEVVFTDKRQARKGVHTLDIAKRLIEIECETTGVLGARVKPVATALGTDNARDR